jgi:carboxyl-terminal processing protease
MRQRKLTWWIIVLVLLALIAGFFAGNFISGKSISRKLFRGHGNKMEVVLDIINEEYVDNVDMEEMMEDAIQKVIGELDPHSGYIPASELGAINENMDGHFAGVGIEYIFNADTLIVINVTPGGPSEQAGLCAGDRIVSVDDLPVTGGDYSEEKILASLRGEIGTSIKLGVKRSGSSDIISYTLTRDYILLTTVKGAYEVAPGIGLIKIYDKFSHTTYDEFVKAMARLLSKGCKSFIIDLRMNGGGSFDAAIHICNEFLPAGRTIVYTEGKSFPREDVAANGLGTLQENQIIVLMDQMSASASEIVAGAIQDNDRGLIIGRRSFGKGLVQNQIELSDGSAVRLTIARYFTPSGRNIQRKYELGKADEYNREWIDRLSRGEEFYEDSINVDTSDLYYTVNGRKVYGGGGIIPDIFVPVDTAELTTYYVNLENKEIFRKFAFVYSDENRSKLSTFKNYQDMWAYLKTQPILYEIVRFAEEKGVKRRTNLINLSANRILGAAYAYILQNYFGEEVFFIVYMDNDSVIKKAIEVIQKGCDTPEAIASMRYREN